MVLRSPGEAMRESYLGTFGTLGTMQPLHGQRSRPCHGTVTSRHRDAQFGGYVQITDRLVLDADREIMLTDRMFSDLNGVVL